MISARYREIGVRMENFQHALQELRTRYHFVSRFSVGAYPIGDPELIYSSWWFIEYRMGGRFYSVIVDECNGSIITGQRSWLPRTK